MPETPTKADIDRHLSMLLHESREKAQRERSRIHGEFVLHGLGHGSSRLIVTVAAAIDEIHAAAIGAAMRLLSEFAEQMNVKLRKLVGWARLHLENMGNALLAEIPSVGLPGEQQRLRKQHALIFAQRLDGALRDLEIGFVHDRGDSSVNERPKTPAARFLERVKTRDSAEHIKAATPLLSVIVFLVTGLSVLFVVAGIVLVGAKGDTEISFLGSSFKSQNVGGVSLFLGAVLIAYVFRRVISSIERLGKLSS
jgi:hypothetical protein